MKFGKCRLCLKERDLCESHIIPEFLYKAFYDDQHKFWVLDPEHEDRLGKRFKGIWEHLLCQGCERKFRDWEDYASRVLYGPEILKVREYPGLLLYEGIDYRKFKLFLLSILWRMGIAHQTLLKASGANRTFQQVRLGPHEEILCNMLNAEVPGAEYEYGCIIGAIKYKDRVLEDFLLEPEHWRVEAFNGYRLCIAGFALWFLVSKEASKFPRKEFFLQTNGSQRIDIGDVRNFGFVTQSFQQMQPIVRKNINRVRT